MDTGYLHLFEKNKKVVNMDFKTIVIVVLAMFVVYLLVEYAVLVENYNRCIDTAKYWKNLYFSGMYENNPGR